MASRVWPICSSYSSGMPNVSRRRSMDCRSESTAMAMCSTRLIFIVSFLGRLLGDGLGLTEGLDPRAIVVEDTTEHLIGVLAGRGHGADTGRRLRELDRRPRQVHLARHRIVHLHEHLA